MRRPAAAWKRLGREARGAPAPIVILSGGGGAAEVEGPHWLRRPAAAESVSRLGSVQRFPGAPTRTKSTFDLPKSGSQGSMDKYVHRPCFLFFVYLYVRLTKPPQIAGSAGRRIAGPAVGVRLAAVFRPAAIGAGFVRLAVGWTCPRPAGEALARRRPGQNPLSLEGGITGNRPPWSKPAFTGGKPPRSARKCAPPRGRALRPTGKTPARETAPGHVVKTGVFCTYSEGAF